MKKMEFVTRIKVNGERKEVYGAKATEVVHKSVENALKSMNYEKKVAG